MFNIFRKSRKYPIKYDEYGRASRQQAFALFSEKYRPSQIFRENLIPVPLDTLFRYFEDWKKQRDLEIKPVDRRNTTKSVYCRISALAYIQSFLPNKKVPLFRLINPQKGTKLASKYVK